MRQTSLFLLLGLILLPLLAFGAARDQTMTSQILTASSRQTVVAAEFDQAALNLRLTSMEFGDRSTDGFGTILAIAGHGVPQAHVLNYELGEAVQPTMSLAEADIASASTDLVILGEPAVFHDLRIVALNFRPLMRDGTGAVRTVSHVQAEVVTSGGTGVNETDDPTSFSSAFYPVYQTMVANLDDVYPEASQRIPGRFLVITSASRLQSISASPYWQSWQDLKRRKGYQLEVLGLTDTTKTAIRTQIQVAYNDHSQRDLEYVMIIGDVSDIPTWDALNPEVANEHSVGDNKYACLAGGDLLPDVLIGRVSGQSPAEYSVYFAKVISYETDPYLVDTRWFQSITCVAGNYAEGGTYPVTPVWNVNWARSRMMYDGCITNADTFYVHNANEAQDPGHWTLPIRQDIDSGVCAVFYRGWGGSQCWQYPVWCNNNVDQLNNVRRTPAVFAIVCGSGNFAFGSGQCLGEKFTTGIGTVTQPKGAIAYIGATDLHTNTRHNNAILGGIVSAMMDNGVRSMGALLMAGKLEGWRQFPIERNNGQSGPESASGYYYILHVFNLLGDPETQIYVCTPSAMTIANPSQLTRGQTLVPVTVTSSGQPVAGAVVTLRTAGSSTVQSVRTDAAGQAYLPADFAASDTAAQLTVWKSRYFMQRINIPLGSAAFDPKLTGINWGDGHNPNPGQTASFTLNATNFGTAPANLSATVTSLDPRITVTTGTGTFGTIQPGQSGASSTLAITLSGPLYNGEHPRLSVLLQDGSNNITREIQVPVAAPELIINHLRVDDGGNGMLEAGESNIPIYITATNVGGQNGSNLAVIVSSWDNSITFPSTGASWSEINMGQSVESSAAFNATLAGGVTPGRQILLRFEVRQNGVECGWTSYLLSTGVVTPTSPTGPDAYGYYAYENIDAGYAATPTYNWIELNGNGGQAHDVRDDTYFTMPLPAQFTYYGQTYSNIWICSNGWFSFEQATIPEFRNWELPSPVGTPSLVAPFWTDLTGDRNIPNDDTLHYVWTRYDQDQSRFIIEWRTFNRAGLDNPPNNEACNFEAILEYHPSGDGSILLQYDAVSILNRIGANFFTVGWEDARHVRGLTMAYANTYPASADTVRAGRAIRITTQAPDNFTGTDPLAPVLPKQFALHEAYPNPFNPATELRFDLISAGRTTLKVYDMLGREVATLVDGHRAAGSYTVSFDASGLPSGLYFARLSSGANVKVKKLMLLK